jgi:hypothetical protein
MKIEDWITVQIDEDLDENSEQDLLLIAARLIDFSSHVGSEIPRILVQAILRGLDSMIEARMTTRMNPPGWREQEEEAVAE